MPDGALHPPVPPNVQTLALCGGTFDPPHRAHVDLPLAARDALGADWLVYVVAHRSPFKADEAPGATDAQRLEMLRLALAGHPRVSVSDLETRRDGPSYTIDTVREFQRAFPAARLRLLIGADQAAQFHRWREARALLAAAPPAVMLRPPHESPDSLRAALAPHWSAPEVESWLARVVQTPLIDVSATALRDALRAGRTDDLRGALDPRVLAFIRERGLYGYRAGVHQP